ncbi:FYN-binding protein 1 isoform X2 [Girardinichthys multiradiatus]|uniref:FYN-binding protein 1 isoform X2 n=1 Tax=Girardinichthys multiradiatus TaxID=208333 RepID=UPI001FAE667D|nr:FYN-binding protein 1 isoform X2 [Girardinichthys multiradiatus]
MEESVDVKALRARFNSQARTSDTSSRDSSSPKSPRPGFGRVVLPATENELAHKIASTVPPRPYQGLAKYPKEEPVTASAAASFPRLPPVSPVRTSIHPGDTNKVKQTGEMLQNMMLRHQKLPGASLSPARSPVPGPSPTTTPLLLRQQPRQKSSGEVTPLRRPLPPEGPLPLKPKRPPNVNLEPFRKFRRGTSQSDQRRCSMDIRMPVPAMMSAPKPPQRSSKPNRLPRQIASVDFEDEQETYDDIGSFEKNESCSDNNSQQMDRDDDDDDDVYEFIDEDQVGANHLTPEKNNQKDTKSQEERGKKEQLEHQKKQAELKKNFQIKGEVNVLHTARVRCDWQAEEKLDLSVRQGESVEILRVENNPRGKWLARSMSGQYGYISNSCMDIDYEAVKKFKMPPVRKFDTFDLPPPPPDPPAMLNMESNNRDSLLQDDGDYDDVQPLPEDFPPPPLEIINPKVEKELRKKFKYDGPLRVLHCMMVDPNCVIKKLGGKDLQVTQGEVVDIIDETNSKKCLCRNRFGKYGYVSKSLLLPMEGDIYDDVDYPDDVYDNDNPNMDYRKMSN